MVVWEQLLQAWRPANRVVNDRSRSATPSHVALIVVDAVESNACTHQLASVLRWCSLSGMHRITLYEPTGVLLQQMEHLRGILGHQSADSTPRRISIQVGACLAPPPDTVSETALKQGQESLQVELVCSRDVTSTIVYELNAHQGVANAARSSMSMHVGSGFDDSGLHTAEPPCMYRPLEEALTKPCEDSNLELIIVFGSQLTLAGFPPWQTHLCEIRHAGPLQSVNETILENILHSFYSVKQRFGR